MKKTVNILQIVTESTQTLDYTLPIINHLREDKYTTWNITIFYCSITKERFTKGSSYLESIDDRLFTKSIDLSYLDKFKASFLVRLFKAIVGSTLSDSLSIKNYFQNLQVFGITGLKYLFTGIKKRFEDRLIDKYFAPEDLFCNTNPDIIWFDNRASFKNKASQKVAKFLSDSNFKIAVIPHAPHSKNDHDEFFPIASEVHPPNVEYWGCLNKSEPSWPHHSDDMSGYYFIGLPALDKRWYRFTTPNWRLASNTNTQEELYILYIPQKFNERFYKSSEDQFDVISYDEELENIRRVLSDLDRLNLKYRLVIKPHPKISLHVVRNLLNDLDHQSVELTNEPLFYHMERANFAISELSSAIIYCACYVPVLLVDTKLNQYVRELWSVLDELYNVGYIYNNKSLEYLVKALDDQDKFQQIVEINRDYLSHYFGKTIAETAKQRLMKLVIQ